MTIVGDPQRCRTGWAVSSRIFVTFERGEGKLNFGIARPPRKRRIEQEHDGETLFLDGSGVTHLTLCARLISVSTKVQTRASVFFLWLKSYLSLTEGVGLFLFVCA